MNGPYVGAENLQPLPFVWFMDFLDSPKRKVRWLRLCTVVMCLMIWFSGIVRADEKILVAAASDLNFAMNEICRAFEKSHPGIKVEVSYGSSGNFYAQIKQGAPYDIFFSADASYPSRLEEEGFCRERPATTLCHWEDCALDSQKISIRSTERIKCSFGA